MPARLPTPCQHPGCPWVGPARYCPAHARRQEQERGTPPERGYTPFWRRLRSAFLQQHPLCIHCLQQGRTEPACEVDHILPLRAGGSHDIDNLQPLCGACHRLKTNTSDGGLGRRDPLRGEACKS